MDVNVLGSLGVEENGRSVMPSAAKPRQLLALLALHADRVVTVPTLMEEIWGYDPPRSASTTLQTYILQLRRRISAALDSPTGDHRDAKELLTTRFGGYLLRVQPGRVDAHEFERLAQAGRSAYSSGDYRTASNVLSRSLDLWQGPALVDLPVGPVLELEVLRLTEQRMAALELRIDSDLRIGSYAEVVPELRVLTARHPLHEGLCARLMLALHRTGESSRALDAYQRLRDALVRELGLEPSHELRELQQAVLSRDVQATLRPVGVN